MARGAAKFALPVLVLGLVAAAVVINYGGRAPNLYRPAPHFPTVVVDALLDPSTTTERVLDSEGVETEVDRQIFFFNRIHKTGSTNFVNTFLQALAVRNGFAHVRTHFGPDFKRMNKQQMKDQLRALDRIDARPLSYDRHCYFFDFEQFHRKNPIWFTLVREPVSKFESRYYYSRNLGGRMHYKFNKAGFDWIDGVDKEEWRDKDIDECVLGDDPECDLELGVAHDDLVLDVSIPYFCGHSEKCQVLGSRWAFQQAKMNVEKWYPVVGVLEELNTTLTVLERDFPQYFGGVMQMYEDGLKDRRRNHGAKYKKLSAEARSAVAANMTVETEFYEYIRQRLHGQLLQGGGSS